MATNGSDDLGEGSCWGSADALGEGLLLTI